MTEKSCDNCQTPDILPISLDVCHICKNYNLWWMKPKKKSWEIKFATLEQKLSNDYAVGISCDWSAIKLFIKEQRKKDFKEGVATGKKLADIERKARYTK